MPNPLFPFTEAGQGLLGAAANPDISRAITEYGYPLLQSLMPGAGEAVEYMGHLGSSTLREMGLQNELRQQPGMLEFGSDPDRTPRQQRTEWFRENPPSGLRGKNPFPDPDPFRPTPIERLLREAQNAGSPRPPIRFP